MRSRAGSVLIGFLLIGGFLLFNERRAHVRRPMAPGDRDRLEAPSWPTCLVRFDNNKYSVNASAVGAPVEIHAYADRIVFCQKGRVVAEHVRAFGRGATIFDPWHYVPVLAHKPGALRNGPPFKDRVLPGAIDRVRRKLAGSNDGDRQMVKVLAAVVDDGLTAVEAACAEANAAINPEFRSALLRC